MRLPFYVVAGIALLAVLPVLGCETVPNREPRSAPSTTAVQRSGELSAERRGIAVIPGAAAECPGCQDFRSLVVTEVEILKQFSFEKVMAHIACPKNLGCDQREAGRRALALFAQWWDTQNASGPGPGPKCREILFGHPYQCRRQEGDQTTHNPFTNNPDGSEFVPVGLFNRIDLIDEKGRDCGEYRIVFARSSGRIDGNPRLFLNFESVLPNPHPDRKIAGCKPIAEFWHSLSSRAYDDQQRRADALFEFYFQGLPGFGPVVHPDNYGARRCTAETRLCPTGQIRTNQFMQSPWMLREFLVVRDRQVRSLAIRIEPDTVKDNPFGEFFKTPTPAFRQAFLDSVSELASRGLGDLCYGTADACLPVTRPFDTAQSVSEAGGETDYLSKFLARDADGTFRRDIEARLTGVKVTTADQVINRAQALSCAGCHELSNGADLGGFAWPTKNEIFRFVHVSEQHIIGPRPAHRYATSQALAAFLPHRRSKLGWVLGHK